MTVSLSQCLSVTETHSISQSLIGCQNIMQDADIAGKATTANATGSETLIPNMSDGFATGAGAAGFETNDKTYAPTPGAGAHGGTSTVDATLNTSNSKSKEAPSDNK